MTVHAPDPMDWLPTDATSLLDAALAYASHGFAVLPVWGVRFVNGTAVCACGKAGCTTPGKHPIERGWQKKASSDIDVVRDARRSRPYANIGLAMGGAGRLVAVDIDGEAGRASWAELERNVCPAPVTLTSKSGRPDGGEHRIYYVPPHFDIKRLGNRASFRWSGIDTRIDNGQIVVAPSVHASGLRYTWTTRAPIAEMPEWLFEALAAPAEMTRAPAAAPAPASSSSRPGGQVLDFVRPYVNKVIENGAAKIATARPGQRNSLLFATSCTVFEYHVGEGLDHVDAWGKLAAAAAAAGLPTGEVSATLAKAWRKAQASPRRVPPPTGAGSEGTPPATPPSSQPLQSGQPAPAPSTDVHWEATLVRTGEGYVKNTFGNVCKVLRHADEFRGRLSYNRMRVTPYVDGRPMRDTDLARFRESIEAQWGFSPARESVMQAVGLVAEERSFHPVQDYLAGLSWDGAPRIERVAAEVLGDASPDALTQRMLRCWFISAVARALTPGCKVDTTLVLVGEQRRKKSTFFATLGGEWFSDSYADIRSKDGVLQVHAAWLYEWAEIDRVTTRNSSSDVKAFLTIARDDVRPPYGMGVVNQPRSSVIVGTTNKPFLDDETGSRRFWPVRVERLVDVGVLRAWRDQLWAEAVSAFKGGEAWWLSEDEERARESVAGDHMVENPWLERIGGYLRQPGREQFGVTIADVLTGALGLELGRLGRGDETRVGKTLRQLGWTPRQETRGTLRVRIYRPGAQLQPGIAGVVQRLGTNSEAITSASQPAQPAQQVLQPSGEGNEGEGKRSPYLETGLVVRAGCAETPAPSTAAADDDSFASWWDRQQ